MAMSVSIEEIGQELNEFGVSASEDILLKMKELCFVLQCNEESIVETWVAFSTTKNCDMTPTMVRLNEMEKEESMKKSSKSSKQRKSHNTTTTPVYNADTIDVIDGSYGIPNQTTPNRKLMTQSPMFASKSASPLCTTPSVKYNSRTTAGQVACSFGEVVNVIWTHSDEFPCIVGPYQEDIALRERYTYMFEKLRDYCGILNDMIEDMAVLYQQEYGVEDWSPIQLPSVEDVPVIGRICSDNTGKLNAISMLLEGSQQTSSGQVVPLDVSRLEKYSLFPGQIIAGQGINPLGKKIVLSKLYEPIFPPLPQEVPDLSNCLDNLSVVIAAGPFTTSDTLSYEPLHDLMKYVKNNRPHACILVGPFVDSKHEEIERGNIGETYENSFHSLVSNILKQLEDSNTKVVLVPSTRDIHHDFVYPTPPFRFRQHSKKLYLASNPCLIKIDGVVFGITSTDILFHLGKEEISFQPECSDRMKRLCSHILSQRNFYPVYPAHEDINIDFEHYESNAKLPVIPHVLVLPSDLRYFIKDVKGCCCINPERITKRISGGTFARLKVKKVPTESYAGSIVDYMQVEIVRI